MKSIKIFFLTALFISLSTNVASAAVLSVAPARNSVAIGEEVTVSVNLTTTPESANAVQATLEFPLAIFDYVKEDRSKSVFNFWVEEPTVSGNKITFTGGTPSGVSGTGLSVVTFTFKSKGAGTATFSLDDSIVTANDGLGTNILQEMQSAKITVGVTAGTPASSVSPGPTSPGDSSASTTIEKAPETPKLVVRTPEKTAKKPVTPEIRIPLYPEENRWYNTIGAMTVFWELPPDVSKVAAIVDEAPLTIPSKFDSELYDGKNLGQIKEGVHYLHVRFQNLAGAGTTRHRKIQIDTTSPLPFTIQSDEGAQTDNPAPNISFEASDELSGIDHYEIKIDSQDVLISEDSSMELPVQKPGKKVIVVVAVDKAGNTKSWFYNIEILPIKSPTISPFEASSYIGEGNLLVRGTAQSENLINATLKSSDGAVQGNLTVVADKEGNWELVFNEPLKGGFHTIEVIAQDDRGAQSLPVLSDPFKVKIRPLLTLGGWGITPNLFFFIVVLIILIIVSLSVISYQLWKKQVGRRVVIAQRDVTAAFDMIAREVDDMLGAWSDGKITKSESTTLESRLRKVSLEVKKLQKYITQNIGGISK